MKHSYAENGDSPLVRGICQEMEEIDFKGKNCVNVTYNKILKVAYNDIASTREGGGSDLPAALEADCTHRRASSAVPRNVSIDVDSDAATSVISLCCFRGVAEADRIDR